MNCSPMSTAAFKLNYCGLFSTSSQQLYPSKLSTIVNRSLIEHALFYEFTAFLKLYPSKLSTLP